jgi:hypothetical protein
LSYGIIKLFALQMPFPLVSQLATPLGDLLPMRFSWFFIGYSVPTSSFPARWKRSPDCCCFPVDRDGGTVRRDGAFLNVVMINLSYDVPVKLFSSHLLFASVFLLALDYKRILGFMVLNRSVPATNAWQPRYAKPWHRWVALGVKLFIVWVILVQPLQNSWTRYKHSRPRRFPDRSSGVLRRPSLRREPRHHPGRECRHPSLEGRDHRQPRGGQA